MANHMADEERQSILREKAEWVRLTEREQEKKVREDHELAHQRRVADSQRRFKKQVCHSWSCTWAYNGALFKHNYINKIFPYKQEMP